MDPIGQGMAEAPQVRRIFMSPKGTLWAAAAFDGRSGWKGIGANGLARACKYLVTGGRNDGGVLGCSALWN